MGEEKKAQLTIKKGILAIVGMYVCQLLAGIITSYAFKLFVPSKTVPIEIIGVTSVLLSGIMILFLFWWDLNRYGKSLYAQIGLQASKIKNNKAVLLVIAALVLTHFLAWIYRSVILPSFDQAGIIGSGSKMFSFIHANGGALEMSGFLLLALIVGPIMEEVVFRGYLQSSLTKRIPAWAAILITSVVFTAGHSPMILWPMYFLFSITWGWIYLRTESLKMAILIHVLSNLFYTVIGFTGWDILA
ncbi:CPBP family intramembrane glutamic endopeptidase [Psychroserpens ponticola]|uniref:CPBP family intramembrane metalloprotease n=1 Tax=Psychroserpens ponticola TaxID=2932268 RepID=A0ABY7S1A1_9FLAO|nr:CPBP family intramembrane glutamic endopeptidase [Psychroserpens ponticola]WCO03176.1 CPBP family intramembrane metalloprotease [Psychroserpens ponticola]